MSSATKIPVTTLVVTSLLFDKINLPALFELRAAGWSVEIQHCDYDVEPCIFFCARRLFPDDSPGISPGDELHNEVCEWLQAFTDKYDAFFDGIYTFKNPRAQDWKFDYWRDGDSDSDFWKTYEGRE
jgi:hypothetical protein